MPVFRRPMRAHSSIFTGPILGLLLALAHAPAATITIDGDMADWAGTESRWSVPADRVAQADSARGAVSEVWVTHDEVCLYFRLDFVQSRPWAEGKKHDEFVSGFWENMRYVRLDVDLDGAMDYYTNQHPGARPGKNNTYVFRMVDEEGQR